MKVTVDIGKSGSRTRLGDFHHDVGFPHDVESQGIEPSVTVPDDTDRVVGSVRAKQNDCARRMSGSPFKDEVGYPHFHPAKTPT
ncbi:hypothetical protein PACID_30160 [Acidipropionibacterium acidipropionici ATCC 4875]|uniref:Uncharacterized protein n=1 Tax=Acidipropionibacterium acidipropionici (strain ATCC 4875 / DSM 20272 / JCM 6432 / NBRC 12425 / NCIMB 8070 / 4) TaxID=1171373 RepID=K7RWI3_ACIA4|nr:hypothetical protein [Acidipropionibacterium acidipropionici]AFV90781.1 hypothetical protein PACID_30160 [Acidipropionibacterium acidipropionici ATCC 4875]ALN15067.1 hypothetical protein ASQ49_07070 [Acidipropionibacterium acidipropionici]APZ09182.1 hypothetical protein BWX38_07860 [Acidipropionibacterium acidipropionici]MDN6555180.1 hypothetical protein [Acidipropionibacterium acidipropionici]